MYNLAQYWRNKKTLTPCLMCSSYFQAIFFVLLPQDYVAARRDPDIVGKTAQEKSPAWLRHCGGFVFYTDQMKK